MPEGKESRDDLASLIQALLRSPERQTDGDRSPVGLQLLEASAGAFACGLLRGRWGGVEVGGVPVDLGAGVLLHLLGLSGAAGSRSQDLHNLADGALATYFATWGATLGKRMRNGEQILPLPRSQDGASERAPTAKAAANGTPSADDIHLMELMRTTISS